MKKTRNSYIELLRIISMLMIVFHHFALHSGFYFSTKVITLNQLWCEFIEMGGKIGVDIFVIISGYFLITSEKVKAEKVIKILLEVIFYSLGIYIIICSFGIQNCGYNEFIHNVFPITYNDYWFISAYFVLYLLHPFINRLLKNLTEQEYQKMLLLMFVMWSVIPSFLFSNFQSNSLIWFVFVYAIGGYIRIYKCFENIDYRKMLIGSFILIIIKFLIVLGCDVMSLKNANNWNRYAFYDMNNFITLPIAILLFLSFKNMKMKNNAFINTLANATLGIYLIHDNIYMRNIIWKDIFNTNQFINNNFFVGYSIGVCLIVFLTCLLIELIRIYILEKNYMRLFSNIDNNLQNIIKKA